MGDYGWDKIEVRTLFEEVDKPSKKRSDYGWEDITVRTLFYTDYEVRGGLEKKLPNKTKNL